MYASMYLSLSLSSTSLSMNISLSVYFSLQSLSLTVFHFSYLFLPNILCVYLSPHHLSVSIYLPTSLSLSPLVPFNLLFSISQSSLYFSDSHHHRSLLLSISLPASLSSYPFLSVHQSLTSTSLCLSIYQLTSLSPKHSLSHPPLSTNISIYLSISLSIHLYLSLTLFIHLYFSIYLSIYLSLFATYLSTSLSQFLSLQPSLFIYLSS